MAYEQQFSSSLLEVIAPDAAVEFPAAGANGDAWYAKLKVNTGERTTALFDEELEFILIMRTPGPSDMLDDTAPRPSADLLSFLAHIQVALEVSYIQPAAASGPGGGSPGGTRLGAPPRTARRR